MMLLGAELAMSMSTKREIMKGKNKSCYLDVSKSGAIKGTDTDHHNQVKETSTEVKC